VAGVATRRAVLAGAGATALVALTGCAVYGNSGPPPAPPPGGGAGGGGGDAGVAKVSDIPVGGGRIISDQQIVVTQPTAGTFACFGAVCTHQGCLVTDVSGGTINCACHGSRFSIADGSVAAGPAPSPLPAVGISVDGDTIRRT
jgi:Rieske Fe-S protein